MIVSWRMSVWAPRKVGHGVAKARCKQELCDPVCDLLDVRVVDLKGDIVVPGRHDRHEIECAHSCLPRDEDVLRLIKGQASARGGFLETYRIELGLR